MKDSGDNKFKDRLLDIFGRILGVSTWIVVGIAGLISLTLLSPFLVMCCLIDLVNKFFE